MLAAVVLSELADAHALSTHRSRVLVRRQFSLPAYMRVTNFCHMFGRRNGGRLIRGTAYTRVYTVPAQFTDQTVTPAVLITRPIDKQNSLCTVLDLLVN